MSSVSGALHFHDEEAAYAFVEARIWPNGPVYPHCGSVERIGKMAGKSTRIGAYKCYPGKFTRAERRGDGRDVSRWDRVGFGC